MTYRHLMLAFASAAVLGASSSYSQTATADVEEFASLVREYNLVDFGNANLSMIQNDTEGPLAVEGNLSLSGSPLVNFNQFATSSDPTLYVNGNLSIHSGMTADLNNGYASLNPANNPSSGWGTQQNYTTSAGGILNTTNAQGGNSLSSQNPTGNPAPANWNFATIKSNAVSISDSLAGMAANGTITASNNQLVFNANGNTGVVIFNLNAALLGNGTYNGQNISGVTISVPKNTEYVVNVTNASGATLLNTNFNTPGGTAGASQLLWNIVNTGSSDISTTLGNGGQFYGSVLAPMVNLSNVANDPVSGQVLTDSLTYTNAQLNYTGFVAIPETPLWPLAAGVAALLIATTRRIRPVLR